MADIQEPKTATRKTPKPLTSLFPYLKRYRGLVAAAIFALVLSSATTLALPLAVRRIIDHGFEGADGAMINSYFAVLLATAVVLALASAMRYYYVMTIGERVVADLRRDVFAHLTSLSQAFFDVNHSGELASRLTADTVQIRSAFGSSASQALRNILLCLGGVVMMVYTSPSLSGLALLAIPLIVFPLIAFGRSVRSRSRTTQDTLATSSAFAAETISASRTIQSFNAETLANTRYNDAVEKAYHGARAAISARAVLTAVAISFVFGSVVAILWYGAHGVLIGTISAGTLSQFVLYSVIAASSLGQLSEVWGELSQAGGAAERLSELLQEKSPVTNPGTPVALPVPARGEASFENVAFHYPQGAGRPVITDLSFTVAAGETVAIVGPSGAGKSTVFSLLMRFYDPQSGRITIDGTDIRAVTLEELRSRLAIVPQDVAIFAASIHDNIAFGKPNASRDEVRTAAITAQADGFIANLDNGYDTIAGERGVTLSGGQRQRIAIARAILRDAPILLLDEATSALDAESETLVQKALDQLIAKRTTIVIAHRLATVLKADRILVMDEGRIIEEGTHQSLIRQGGLYAKLARLQFETDSADEVVTLAKSN
ncbi:ABC transporter transmembrane domain-containing protein [Agrobacterium rubi]|uniref:ATP-binding cassette domain-containing protein n=1 Tax=Agrobacterium rubi TaxID=28099 RepID=A0AAE7R6E4_9HYPH|nr:ABC transporter transmembrane domain-containing protein [Agrobacterium rubi]NTE87305.1 ATP-binding cassette domain-containing protein [Agrobacterium rubi]NTF03239.1 ATP-binding cassette domain-containing protein [Agrobacterium rubi]NTF37399.1 ATP-binding cassette domain-containing protein [Agrobacterium rubi]OCJ55051.1 ABC transporter [Agrobacterium rubi]QTF99811.1 ATP-binding cassette domain-containing protein [Agrobacterium rubi]